MYQSFVHSNMTDMQYEIKVSERKIKQRKDVKRQREEQTHTKKLKKVKEERVLLLWSDVMV